MTKFILTLTIMLTCFGIGAAQTGKTATAQEKKDLFQLILADRQVVETIGDIEGGANKLVESLEVEKRELNKDGQPEYVAVLTNDFLCGTKANCPQWVYRKTDGQYELLLRTFGQQLTSQKITTNNFADLRSEGSDSAYGSSAVIYKFDGSRYEAKECLKLTYNDKTKKTKTTRVQCEVSGQ